jgi:hypothetical protein
LENPCHFDTGFFASVLAWTISAEMPPAAHNYSNPISLAIDLNNGIVKSLGPGRFGL